MSPPTTREDIVREMVIAIDGPSASGKTTTARGVARRLGLRHVDTGAMYRAITLKAMGEGVDLGNAGAVGRVAAGADIDFVDGEAGQAVVMDGEDVTQAIRSPEITRQVSLVSTHAEVRHAMVRRQRAFSDQGGVVLEGRDIGSVVLPSAHVKIYLDASIDVRAARRRAELEARGTATSLEAVRSELQARDHYDSTRSLSPLRIPIGARIVDTSRLTIEEQIEQVVATAEVAAARIVGLLDNPGRVRLLRKRNPALRAGQWFFFLIAKVFWGMRVVHRDHRQYAENYIYACNHRSNGDPPIVGSTIQRNLFFVAKRALFRFRPFGWVISKVNAVPIRRGAFDRAALDTFLDLLEQGHSILIFPEGGRSRSARLRPPKAGAGYLALKSGKPVYPMYVDGTLSLKRSLFRKPHLTVIHGRPMRLTDTDLSKYQDPEHYRDFGAMVMCAIEALQDEHQRPPGAGTC
ncbi:MAG: (d)CMP kinase [Candidatus Krumholzibacteriia bacterium]